MLTTNQLIRRYTPPTCTLEIQGKSSLLSRWKGSNIVRNLWFQLSFEDCKLPEEEKVKICGDRFQLEELCEIVGEYVQKFLSRTSWDDRSIETNLPADSLNKPYLKQKGMLEHELYFSSIAGKKEPKVVKLSSIQLFDLANVLEEFASDITLLPVEKDIPIATAIATKSDSIEKTDSSQKRANKPKNPKKLPSWTTAAASFLVASGATFAGMHFYYQSQSQPDTSVAVNTATSNATQTPTPTNEINKDNSVPLPPQTTTIPIPSNTLPPSLSNQNTPPPPPIAIQTPINQTQTQPNINSRTNSQGDLSGKSKNTPPPTTSKTTPNRNTDRNRNVNNDNPKTQSSPIDNNTNKNDVATINIDEAPPPSSNNPAATQTETNTETNKPVEEGKVFSGYTPNSTDTDIASGTFSTNDALSNNAPTAMNRSGNTPATVSANTQVEEVQKYFQSKWQPPEGLAEPLEYSLSISNSGSIQSITPVGKTAATYLDRTNMPLLNESFVSPSNSAGSTKIRLVLNPDGTVKTFPE